MSSLPRTADAVIIGGGVVGCSIACALSERGVHVVVCEAAAMLASGSTGASVGGIRRQFGEAHNIRLTQQSLVDFNAFEERYGQAIDFVRNGYLLLASTEATWAKLQADVALQRKCGVPTQLLDAAAAREIVPGLLTDDLLGVAYGPEDGFADPSSIAQGFAATARRAGAVFAMETSVIALLRGGDRVTGVDTPRGAVAAGAVIDAAGPRVGLIARMAGVELPVQPTRRHVFTTAPTDLLAGNAPLTIDLDSPCYFRPESGGVLFSGAEEEPVDPDRPPHVEWDTLEAVAERVMRRLPRLEAAQVRGGWTGLRTVTPDRTALLGEVPGVPGVFVAGGFSGHGVMHSPATGRIIADLVCDGRTDRCDMRHFAVDRFPAREFVLERRAI